MYIYIYIYMYLYIYLCYKLLRLSPESVQGAIFRQLEALDILVIIRRLVLGAVGHCAVPRLRVEITSTQARAFLSEAYSKEPED